VSFSDHPGALRLAAARGVKADAAVRAHLEECVACRVRAARLWHAAAPGEPGCEAVSRILAASAPGPALPGGAAGPRSAGPPRPGELWRAGRGEALLVWVRRVLPGAVDVLPVVLDVELADQESLLLPAGSTPLGVPLAVLAGVRAHVGPSALLRRVGFAAIAGQVREVMAAAMEGRPPACVEAGPPVTTAADQRIEYRQVIADLLADLAPGSCDT
jgi:hypothetical protein